MVRAYAAALWKARAQSAVAGATSATSATSATRPTRATETRARWRAAGDAVRPAGAVRGDLEAVLRQEAGAAGPATRRPDGDSGLRGAPDPPDGVAELPSGKALNCAVRAAG
ncbi:hypothetical protein [Streptomyces albospinus]|nr:hypothetical protein [Streptomyces albospinus]